MRTVRLKFDCFNSECLSVSIVVCVLLLFAIGFISIFKVIFHEMFIGCGLPADVLVKNLCSAVNHKRIEGGACSWMCEKSAENKRYFKLCPHSENHVTEDNLFLLSQAGPTFGINEQYFDNIMEGYQMNVLEEKGTFAHTTSEYRRTLASTLNKYLNHGQHDELLNLLFNPSRDPIPLSLVQSLNDLLSDQRFVLSLLFYGTGLRSEEPPGTDTETIVAVSAENYCGAVYQTTNLANNTTPLSSIFNQSAESSWSLGPTISSFYLYQVMLHLLDMEEATSEHPYEGTFHLCHINTSQILLHNVCTKKSMSVYQRLDNACTMKVLDISKMLFSRHKVGSLLNKQSCQHDNDCRFYSCMGRCEANSCVVSNHTLLAGILQICHIARTIEDQLLEGQNTTTKGQLYTIVDRCLDLKYFPVDDTSSADELILEYNIIFQDLKMFFTQLKDRKHYDMSREAEEIAAKKEARRHRAAASKST